MGAKGIRETYVLNQRYLPQNIPALVSLVNLAVDDCDL